MDCDNRLIDYWLHSREFAHVDRVKEEWVTARKGGRVLSVPESEARFLDGVIPQGIEPFPMGDEV